MATPEPRNPPTAEPDNGRAWWALAPEAVVRQFGSDTVRGLPRDEAARRLAATGPNRLAAPRAEPWYEEVVEELTEPLILLLLAVGVLYALFGERRDAITIVVIILITIAAEAATEWRARRAVAALAALRAPTAPVVRDGIAEATPVEAIVPGDVVVLAAGERVPADLRLLASAALAVDESALTGESVPSEKGARATIAPAAPLAERATMAYAGTLVTRGEGTGIVVATGNATATAAIARLVAETEPADTPLQREMARLSGSLVWVALGASLLVPALLVAFGTASWRDALLTGLTLAFATIPEELPILITAVLALGAFRLARERAVVKTLRAAEALGSVSVLVSDKTGTLTENRMRAAGVVDATGRGSAVATEAPIAKRAVLAGLMANDAISAERGDPTDRAFFAAATLLRVDPERYRAAHARTAAFPFADASRIVAARYRAEDAARIAVKGAPEAVLARCTRMATEEGDVAMTSESGDRLLAHAQRLARERFRVIATADRRDDLPPDAPRERVEADLTFVAFVLLEDPVRAGAPAAVAALRQAGVRLIMVTGDHPATAGAVGRALGLNGVAPVTGADLPCSAGGHGAELARFARLHPVVARATPEDKFRLVAALEEAGERVAVTGDGINDAPALARASVGVAMGKGGTDVAREAADLVLTDDDIATVVAAVREGRHLYDNLRKAIRFYLAVKVALILATALPALVGLPLPFAPVQIILLELLMDLGASVSFVAEPAEDDVMRRPPRDPGKRLLDRDLAVMVLLGGLSLSAAVLGAYGWARWSADLGTDQARTAAFVAWLIGHVVLALGFRSEREPLLRLGIASNPIALVWLAVAVGVAVAAATIGPMQRALHTADLPTGAWWRVLLLAVAATSWVEIVKWWRWRRATVLVTIDGGEPT